MLETRRGTADAEVMVPSAEIKLPNVICHKPRLSQNVASYASLASRGSAFLIFDFSDHLGSFFPSVNCSKFLSPGRHEQ